MNLVKIDFNLSINHQLSVSLFVVVKGEEKKKIISFSFEIPNQLTKETQQNKGAYFSLRALD